MSSENTIKVVMADDHEIFRDGFRLTLSRAKNIELVAQATNGLELVKQVREHKPHVVITDIKMPVMDGIEATRNILKEWPGMNVIGLSMFDEEDTIVEMLEAGARGYLVKNADKSEVIEAVNTVFAGDRFFCKHTGIKLAIAIEKRNLFSTDGKKAISFTDKEIEIIHLICQEMTTKEISEALFMSVRTVEGWRMRIMDKMKVKNTVGIVIYALQHRLYVP